MARRGEARRMLSRRWRGGRTEDERVERTKRQVWRGEGRGGEGEGEGSRG